MPTFHGYCLWPLVLIPGGLLPVINERQSGRDAWFAWHQKLASHPVLHMERGFRQQCLVRLLDNGIENPFSLSLFKNLSDPVGQHAICYFLLLKVGLCAEEPVMSEPFLVMHSLRPGVKEHLTQSPLGRRCLPTSLSILSCLSCRQAATVASHNLGGNGWGIHECRSYGSVVL